MNQNNDPFEEYRRETDPDKRERSYAWQTSLGLYNEKKVMATIEKKHSDK